MKSSPHIILLVGDEGALAVPHNVQGEAPVFAAERDERAIDEVFTLLARNPRATVTLFADNLAQDFRLESLPRLSIFDRPKLIERRLRQAFPQAALAASARGRHGQILLAGLHGDSPVFGWIERFKRASPGRIPRLALLPAECSGMVTRLLPQAANEWGLILSRQRTGGFRQIVTRGGELVFARLTPPVPVTAPAQEIAGTIARDIKASLGYLARLGLTDIAQLHAVLLMPESAHAALKAAALPLHDVKLLTPCQAAWNLELAADIEPDEPYADRLYAAWFAQKRKAALPLMPSDLEQTRRIEVIRQWGWRAAASVLFAAFVATGWQASDLFTTLFAIRAEAIHLADLKQQLAQEQADAAPITEPLGRLREAVERKRLFTEPTATPWTALHLLSANLGDARLVKFDWHSGGDKPGDEVLLADLRFAGAAPQSNAEREALVARLRKLAQNVAQAMPGYNVRLTRYPYPILPDEALSNDNAAQDASADSTAELTIKRAAP